MNILVTGGAGYIGSHTVIKLIEAGHTPIVVDNLVNSSAESLRRVEKITGTAPVFYELDICNKQALLSVFEKHQIDAVIHFAGLKAVGESTEQPLRYYQNNLDSTLVLLDVMRQYDVPRIVFSSSATVYGSAEVPYKEGSLAGVGVTSPYGKTKFMTETILQDVATALPSFNITILRFFNPIGAHPSGLIGEDPQGIPNNIMPYIAQVAVGKREKLGIFGSDYDTTDGTGVRDYIHVDDLAEGHVAAITHSQPGCHVYNLGVGKGTSVLELVAAYEKAAQKPIAYEFLPRRSGDLPAFYADVSLAQKELGWTATRSIEQACEDSWRWQSGNPNGYAS